jgi:membrane protein implicated in regulation of membrane protease activity
MTWTDFYLICFALGFAFSLLSYLLGGLHWHLPHGLGGAHVHAGHGAGHAGEVSFFNPVTLAAFLAWFGGAGYLLTRFSSVWVRLGFVLALASGLIGAGIMFLFLTRVLTSKEENLDPADFDMVGVLGKLSMPIRAGGTGEITYSQAGTRRACGARAEDGSAIAKGTEVVVTRYEKGIAYVRLWTDMAGEEPASETGKVSS